MAVDKPIAVVVHATSKQGTSAVISLLQTNKFVVKAITRDASSTNAKQLAEKGADLVEADAADAGQLRAAFEGAYGVFAVTVAMGGGDIKDCYENELAKGKLMADAAAAAGVKVFVYSTLEDMEKRTKGKWWVPHFTSKAHVVDYIEAKHRDMIGVYPAVGAFYTNVIEYMPPRPGPDGVLTFALPVRGDVPIQWLNPYTAPGPVVAAAFLEPEKYRGMVIPVYDETLTCEQLVETFTQVTGIKARYYALTKEDMLGAGVPEVVADMQLQMYSSMDDIGYYAPERDMELVHKINPNPETWADFLKKTGFDGSQKLAEVRSKFV